MIFPQEAIGIRKNKEIDGLYDIELFKNEFIQQYSEIEIHFFLYPYSRLIKANDFMFYPYEEYVTDVQSHKRSVYVQLKQSFDKKFGFLLGSIIAAVFYQYKPSDLFSVQSVVSVFAAYTIGKEIWSDIEKYLIEVSQNWKLRYSELSFSYILEKFTTLTRYSTFAKENRYGKFSILAEKMDFIEQSNSQTIRLLYDTKDIHFKKESIHLMSLQISHSLIKEFEKKGFLFGVKIGLRKKGLFHTKTYEYYQSIHKHQLGSLDAEHNWKENSTFFRSYINFGRLKLISKERLFEQANIVSMID